MYKYINYIVSQINLKNLIFYKKSITIAISGGQDSYLLYFFFYNLRYQYNLKIFLISCNHLWQLDSIYNTYNLTKFFWLNQFYFSSVVPFFKLTTESQSRSWRYVAFQRINIFYQNKTLLIGHTSTDMLESFLFYLIRGSGSTLINQFYPKKRINYNKLNCFTFKKSILLKNNTISRKLRCKSLFNLEIIEPIQSLTRFEIFYLITYIQFPTWTDQTNLAMQYSRNRIRYQLLPLLRFFFNQNVDLTIQKFLNIFINDIYFLEHLSQTLKKSHSIKITHFTIQYRFSFFFSCPYVFQKKLLIKSFKFLELQNFTFCNIELVLKILFTYFKIKRLKKKNFSVYFSNNFQLLLSNFSFYIMKK